MNQSELTSFKKRNASADVDKRDEEDLTETAAKKLKSENLNSSHAQYSPNTFVPTSASLHDGSTGFYEVHGNLDKIEPRAGSIGCNDVLDYNTNRTDAVHCSFQQVGGESTGDEQSVSRVVQNAKGATGSDLVLTTAGSFSGISVSYFSTETSNHNFQEQGSCERKSSLKETDIRMTANITPSTVNRQTTELTREHSDASTMTTVTKEVPNQESDIQRDDGAVFDNNLMRSPTGGIEKSVEDLLTEFRRLRIYEQQNAETENAQYYVVAYSSEEGIQKCIITKKWSPENRKFVGKAWDINSGPVYLFFKLYQTNQLGAVATLSPNQIHDSYIGVNFLKVINLPESRYRDDSTDNCTPREIRPMCPEGGRTALETLREYKAECEDEDKSIVDDINESLIVQFGQNVGLRNLGNTCYINCILQCLSKVHWKPPSENLNDELVTEFFRVMSWLSEPGGSGDPISPQHLRTQIAKFSSRFATYQQQDAHELLLYLLGELNKKLKKFLANDEGKENCFQEQFSGKLQNSVVFECGHNIYNDQPFFTVSLSIPEKCRDTGSATVSDCLEAFLAEERLDGDNKAMCLDCSGELKECTLQTQFQQLPSILILHIQRTDFSQLEKLETEISMPLRDLQMKDLSGKMYEYNLFGTCNHYGSLKSGHYTADVKCCRSNKWFTYSDSSIYQMHALSRQEQTEFSSNSASILFYAKNLI